MGTARVLEKEERVLLTILIVQFPMDKILQRFVNYN